MTITRRSRADLLAESRDFTPEEHAAFDRLTEDELDRNARADPDAQPWTDEMLRLARLARRERLASAGLRVTVQPADATQDLPVWAVTDEHGRIVLIQAASIERVSSTSTSMTFKLVSATEPDATEAVTSSSDGSASPPTFPASPPR